MKKLYSILLLAALLPFIGCGKDTKSTTVDSTEAVRVQLNTKSVDTSLAFITVSGKIEAASSANLSTRMMGFVNKVYVKVGDQVKKGQLLVSINNSDLSAKQAQVQAGITEAKVGFTNAEKDYNRFKNLFADNSASQKEMDDMTANYEMAKARLEGAKQLRNEVAAQFSYVNIRAPFSGVITNSFTDAGAMANPGTPLLAMESPGIFEVTAAVPENEISRIKADTEVEVLVKSINKTIKGTVSEISTSAQNTGGQYLVTIALDKTEVPILSGMYASVQFPVAKNETEEHILVLKSALVTKGQLSGLYTVSQSNTALLRWLRLGRSFGDQVEVLSGLTPDESYIISSEGKLYNGAKISIQ